MEKIEKVFKQLSGLYEFNRKLQTYKILATPKMEDQQSVQPDSKNVGGADAEGLGDAAG